MPQEPANWDVHSVFFDKKICPRGDLARQTRCSLPSRHVLLRGRQQQDVWGGDASPARTRLRRIGTCRRRLARVADQVSATRAILRSRRAALRSAWPGRSRSHRAAAGFAISVSRARSRAGDCKSRRRASAARHQGFSASSRGAPPSRPVRSLQNLRRFSLQSSRQGRCRSFRSAARARHRQARLETSRQSDAPAAHVPMASA